MLPYCAFFPDSRFVFASNEREEHINIQQTAANTTHYLLSTRIGVLRAIANSTITLNLLQAPRAFQSHCACARPFSARVHRTGKVSETRIVHPLRSSSFLLCIGLILVEFVLLLTLLLFIAMAPQYEMAVGLKKGHKVTKLQKQERPSRRRGVSSVCSLVFSVRTVVKL